MIKIIMLFLLVSFNCMAISKSEVEKVFKNADKAHDTLRLDYCYELVNNAIKKEMKYRINRGDVYHHDMAIIMDYIEKDDKCSYGRLIDNLEIRLRKNGFETKVTWTGTNSAYCILIVSWR